MFSVPSGVQAARAGRGLPGADLAADSTLGPDDSASGVGTL